MNHRSAFLYNGDLGSVASTTLAFIRAHCAHLFPDPCSEIVSNGGKHYKLEFSPCLESWLLNITSTATGLFWYFLPNIFPCSLIPLFMKIGEGPPLPCIILNSRIVPILLFPDDLKFPMELSGHSWISSRGSENNLPQLFLLVPGLLKLIVFLCFLCHQFPHRVSKWIQQNM